MSTSANHGYLPAGRYIVNHDIMHCTADGVEGNDLYSGRALGLTEADDYIQLHPALKPLWKDITAHYRRVGLSHSENVIWDVSLDQLSAWVIRRLSEQAFMRTTRPVPFPLPVSVRILCALLFQKPFLTSCI